MGEGWPRPPEAAVQSSPAHASALERLCIVSRGFSFWAQRGFPEPVSFVTLALSSVWEGLAGVCFVLPFLILEMGWRDGPELNLVGFLPWLFSLSGWEFDTLVPAAICQRPVADWTSHAASLAAGCL